MTRKYRARACMISLNMSNQGHHLSHPQISLLNFFEGQIPLLNGYKYIKTSPQKSTFRTNWVEPKINLQIFPPSMITMPHCFSFEIFTNYLVKQMYVICEQKKYPLESSLKLKSYIR
jgi:hypothetical protein